MDGYRAQCNHCPVSWTVYSGDSQCPGCGSTDYDEETDFEKVQREGVERYLKKWMADATKGEPVKYTASDLEAARRESFDWLLERFIDLYENEQNPEPENIWQEFLKSLEGREG